MPYMTKALCVVVVAVSVLLAGTGHVHAQSVDIPGDVPGVRFGARDVQACDPQTQVLADPRASGFAALARELGQTDGLATLFSRRAGTIILPTSQAIDDFIDLNGYADLAEMLNRTGGVATWVPIISSYFLSNTSNPPKDIVLTTLVSSPYGQVSVPYGAYGPTPRYNLYTYVDIVQPSRDQYQMVSGYLRFLAPNSTGVGAIVRSGPAANITDFAIACDQYYIYFTDNLMVPSSDPAQLRRFGEIIPTGRAAITDLSSGQTATVPSLSSSSANGTNGRRLAETWLVLEEEEEDELI